MVRLYIENKEVELTDDVQFAITSQFEDLSNPTAIINDWSKTVSIPFTQNNNELFGHIYNPDKVIVEGGGSVGIYFNPLKKLDFRLEWNGAVLMQGYAKMNQVKMNGDKGTYEITLFGKLGKLFQDMQKITFDTSSSDTDYIIDGSQYINETIDRFLIFNSWNSNGQTHEDLLKKTDSGYVFTDIIGFAPNNSFNEDFDYKTFQYKSNESSTFEDVLGESFTEDTGIEPSSAIPDGMLPREIGEYRSYFQLPFIYWNKLFKVFKEKAESVTGYDIELSPYWFNKDNPYWYNLVYMMKSFDVKKGDSKENSYNTYALVDRWRTDLGSYNSTRTFNTNVRTVNYETQPIYVSSNRFNLIEGVDYTTFKLSYRLDLKTESTHRTSLKSSNALLVHVVLTGENGTTNVKKYLFTDDLTNQFADTSDYTYVQLEAAQDDDNDAILRAVFNSFQSVRRSEYGSYVNISLQYRWYANSYPYTSSTSVSEIVINATNLAVDVVLMSNSFRSMGTFTLNDLWNNERNLFGEILKYCKMFRIGVFVDDINKKIKFMPIPTYFKDYTVDDWSDKIDKSKDFVIKPVTLENKYILFNYKDNNTKLGKDYKEKYGVNYGDYRLITEYNFNDEKKELFKDVVGSMTVTDNVLSWTNLYNYHKIVYSFPAELYVNCKDKDNKYVDLFGSFYFHNGLKEFSTESTLHMRSVIISDDTDFQQGNNTYFYTQSADFRGYSVYTYPYLDVVRGNNMCLFNIPNKNYTYLNNYSGKSSIYTTLWNDYIDERYNIQNKLITCYADIKPIDYCNFEFNKFVKVGNQLCMVNKIYDYDVTNNQTTKVDLITIQDVDAYTKNDFIDAFDELTLSYTGMTYLGGGTGDAIEINTFTSISDVTFENGSTSYTTRGILFTISGNTIYAERIEEYVDEEDLEFTITIKNENWFAEFDVTRYSVYPYPYISITDGNGNVVTTLSRNTTYRLNWECTETEGLENKPTVTLTRIAGIIPTLGSDWTVEEKMYGDGTGAEYFRNKYSVSLTTGLAVGSFSVKIVDVEGWNQTRNY